MSFVVDKSGKKPRLRWDTSVVFKRPDTLRSSDFPCFTPQFIPSYDQVCSHNMYDLLGHEYARRWHCERQVWAHKMYPHVERAFFQRRYVIRAYHKRCPKLAVKKCHPTKAKFPNVAPRVDARWCGCPAPCAPPCKPRVAVAKPTCCVHRKVSCGCAKPSCPCTCITQPPPCVCVCEPFVTDCKNPPSVLKRTGCGRCCPRGPGVPRGALGPPGCGGVGCPPCGPAGAPCDRGPFAREPVCVPSHVKGPHPSWLAPLSDAPGRPCDQKVGEDAVCQPPCDVLCLAKCAKCGCVKPCPCEKRARETGRGGKCGMLWRAKHGPGQPCPSRAKGKRICADPCGEVCHVRAAPPPSKEGRGTYLVQLPCPCCLGGGQGGGRGDGVAEATAQDLVEMAMTRAEARGAATGALAAATAAAELLVGVGSDLGIDAGDAAQQALEQATEAATGSPGGSAAGSGGGSAGQGGSAQGSVGEIVTEVIDEAVAAAVGTEE